MNIDSDIDTLLKSQVILMFVSNKTSHCGCCLISKAYISRQPVGALCA